MLKKRVFWALLCILFLASSLRLYNLSQRGMISRDEAWYVYSARGLESRLNGGVAPIAEWPAFEHISSYNVAGKPMYVAMLWLLGAVRGVWDYENVLGLSLFAGILNILAVYWLARSAKLEPATALLASLLAAFSFIDIYFSRLAFPHALIITIHTFALCFYLRADRAKPFSCSLFAAGLLWGIGLSMHMSLVLALPGLLLCELYQQRRNFTENIPTLLRRSFLWGGGIVCILIGWELAYRIAPFITQGQQGVFSLTGSFALDLMKHAESGGVGSNPLRNLLFYGLALLGLENPVLSLLFLIGFIQIWRMKFVEDGGKLLLIFFVTNLLCLIVYPALYGRQLAPLMSIWPVLAGVGLSVLLAAAKGSAFFAKRIFPVTLVLLICLFNLYWVWPLLAAQSAGWVNAARWLKVNAAPGEHVFTSEISDAAMLNYYLPNRVLVWPVEETPLPAQARWYVKNPTVRLVSAWTEIHPLIAEKQASVSFTDPWLLLRPHFVIGGNWLLIPWWRWSTGPASHQPGLDDTIQVYAIP